MAKISRLQKYLLKIPFLLCLLCMLYFVYRTRFEYRAKFVPKPSKFRLFNASSLNGTCLYYSAMELLHYRHNSTVNSRAVKLIMLYTRVQDHFGMKEKLHRCVSSLLSHTSTPIHLMLITDDDSLLSAREVLNEVCLKFRIELHTSIMAVEFGDGVVIGADSRSTTGAYIANRVTDKLTGITDYIYCCRSGSAADTQAIADIVRYHISLYEMEIGEACLVKTAAHIFKEYCYNYREQVTAGIICAGWDKREGGQVYIIPLGGMLVRQPCAIGGSGSQFVYGYVDSNFKPNMTKEECVTFVTNTLALAMSRDGSSGGVIRLGVITKDGIERKVILGDNLPKFYEG